MGSGDKHARLAETIQDIPLHDHLCAIYESPEEAATQCTILAQAGLERGGSCVYIAGDGGNAAVQAMRARGIEPKRACKNGSLMLLSAQQMASKLDSINPDKLIAFWSGTSSRGTSVSVSLPIPTTSLWQKRAS